MEPSKGAFAGVDQWTEDLREYGGLDGLKNVLTQQIPYTVFIAAVAPIQTEWTLWRQAVEQVTKKPFPVADTFLSELATKRTYKLSNVLDISRRVKGAFDALKTCLTSFKSMAVERAACDKDRTLGKMTDIHPHTLQDLEKVIFDSKKDFRLLACALGFDSITCRQFAHPSEILKRWVEQNSEACVQRLYFEASHLGMDTVCDFLKAIPLEGTSDVTFEAPSLEEALDRSVTVFDILHINDLFQEPREITLHIWWHTVIENLPACERIMKSNRYGDGLHDVKLALVKVTLGKLLDVFERADRRSQPILQLFKEEIESGNHESFQSSDITFSQIAPLCQEIVSGAFDKAIKSEELQQELERKIVWPEGLAADEFLLLYWYQMRFLSFEELREKLWTIFSKNSGECAVKLAALFTPALAQPAAISSSQLPAPKNEEKHTVASGVHPAYPDEESYVTSSNV